jgi:hypothetical protein
MATKLGRKELPAGTRAEDFKYVGRAASDQGDFGSDVGIADCACVNQFGTEDGNANNSKYYHAGVVQHVPTGRYYVYLEWGRIKSGKSWNGGGFTGGDYQFVECSSEADARAFFASQMADKNTKRLSQKNIGGRMIWAAKDGKDGYLVQRLATRERGLPDAYTIKDATGVKVAATPAVSVTSSATAAPAAPAKVHHPAVVSLARSLVGGTKDFARAATAATGITPTMAAIEEVRNDLLPAALKILLRTGPDVNAQLKDRDLIDLSKLVATIVPRPIPQGGDPMAVLLTSNNILAIQADLDAFEGALRGEDFSVKTTSSSPASDPDVLLNAQVRHVDPNSDEGRWLVKTYLSMTNNRHAYLSREPKILNVFAVERPDRDAQFLASVRKVAALRKGNFALRAGLQPASRRDLGTVGDLYREANVIFTQHGTRSVNIAPILQTHFRMPKSLSGVPIAGANFGHGNYQATDYRKAVGYTSNTGSAWSGGGGGVQGRGAFMFLCDMIMGDAYRAPSTGSWMTPPNGKDSVFGVGGDRGHGLQNDEHVTFDPTYTRIRYLVEFTQ